MAGFLAEVVHFAQDLKIHSIQPHTNCFIFYIDCPIYYLQVKVDMVDAAVNKLEFTLYILLLILKRAGIKFFCALNRTVIDGNIFSYGKPFQALWLLLLL